MKNIIVLFFLSILFSVSSFGNSFSKTKIKNTIDSPYTNFELTILNKENGASRSTLVFYAVGKTIGHDNGYDSEIFGGATSTYQVYTKYVSEIGDRADLKLAIQTLPKEDYE